ncbi:MAG: rhodanese-like domain-containing protein [Calditrichaeota bacterium]|nr:MAG: rhodanese-like domain-containing protein [Calditrichota bacterium]
MILGCGRNQKTQGNETATSTPAGAYRTVDVEEAYTFIQQHPEALVLDVRTPQEYTGPLGHIPGAHLKPVQQISQWVQELESMKDKPIVVICRSGARSRMAAQFLQEKGFRNVINVDGGMMAWNAKGLPVEKGEGQ